MSDDVPTSKPPLLRSDRTPLYWMGGMLAALVLAPMAFRGWLPVPPCLLRKVAGIPCPLCGGTRCMMALSCMHWGQAICLNPLVAAVFALVVVWAFLWLVEKISGGSWLAPFTAKAGAKIRWPLLLAVLLLNWFFVLWMKVV